MFENFTRLSLHVTGGVAGIDEELSVGQSHLIFRGTRDIEARTVALTDDEMAQLAVLLEKASRPRYFTLQPSGFSFWPNDLMLASDGLKETLIVEVGTGPRRRTYHAVGGANAPDGYRDIVDYLRELHQTRFR